MLNVLQGHRIHTPSLFCSVTHHNLPVLFESRILYLLACSEHRYTCCAQTLQIKRSTGSCAQRMHNVLDKNKAQICCSERTSGNGIMLDRPLPFKLHQTYRPLPRCIREMNAAANLVRTNADLDCCDARLLFGRCTALSSSVQF